MVLTKTSRSLFIFVAMLLTLFIVGGANADSSERGALAPSAPVRLDYELPDVLPDSGKLTIPLQLSTPVRSGQLHFEVVRSEGLSVVDGGDCAFDLRGAVQPFTHELTVVLGAETPRSVLVLVSVDGPMGSLSRSYRIDLSIENAVRAPSNKSLKLLPATSPQ